MSEENKLDQILNEIEQRAKGASRFTEDADNILDHDVPNLVKALRRAIHALEVLNDGRFPIPRSDISIGIELRQLRAILEEKQP